MDVSGIVSLIGTIAISVCLLGNAESIVRNVEEQNIIQVEHLHVAYTTIGYEETDDENVILVKYSVTNKGDNEYTYSINREYTNKEQEQYDKAVEFLNNRNDTACDELLYQIQIDETTLERGDNTYIITCLKVDTDWESAELQVDNDTCIKVVRDSDKIREVYTQGTGDIAGE